MKRITAAAMALLLLVLLLPASVWGEGPIGTFSETDQFGNTITQAIFSQNRVTMINYWTYWCQPCIGELPVLQSLYTDLKSQGFMILGAMPGGYVGNSSELISQNGLTYPCIESSSALEAFRTTGYVPETIFVDSQGNIISEHYTGARSYNDWKAIILQMLNKVATPTPTITATPTLAPTNTPIPTASPTPQYTVHKLQYIADGIVCNQFYVIEGNTFTAEPAVPAKNGMVGVWSQSLQGLVIDRPYTVTAQYRQVGDLDGNDSCNTADAVVLLRSTVGYETLTPLQFAAADMNNDGVVNVIDATTILRKVVGLD